MPILFIYILPILLGIIFGLFLKPIIVLIITIIICMIVVKIYRDFKDSTGGLADMPIMLVAFSVAILNISMLTTFAIIDIVSEKSTILFIANYVLDLILR